MAADSTQVNIKDVILEKLADIEKRYEVKILHACEVGSRAWGLDSATSDYDVKFIYVRRLDWYLSIEEVRRFLIDDNTDFDMNGWDLHKSLQLIKESNCGILEWIFSSHVYKSDTAFLEKSKRLADAYHCRSRLLLAYWGKAGKHYREYIQVESGDGTVVLKKYLFVIQALLFARWVLAFSPNRIDLPPQDFSNLLQTFSKSSIGADKDDWTDAHQKETLSSLPTEIFDISHQLMNQKRSGTLKNGPRMKLLDSWITSSLASLESICKAVPKKGKVDIAPLNQLFVDMVTSASGFKFSPEDAYIKSSLPSNES